MKTKTPVKNIFKGLLFAIGTILLVFLVIVGSWFFRDNDSEVYDRLDMKSWVAFHDGQHNSNTDLIYWKGHFYLVHQNSPYHMASEKAKLLLHRSVDAKNWETITSFNVPGEDIRDPKLAAIKGKLIIYVLKNRGFEPAPYGTAISTSTDGTNWTTLKDIEPTGWLFWRPKSRDGKTWYTTAYWKHHGKSILLKSADGISWQIVSKIHEGDRNDETAMEFMQDGRIIITARLEGDRAWHQGSMNARTLIATSRYPYTSWVKDISRLTRLDGPVLFRYRGDIYAVARFDPEKYDHWYGMSSLLGRKRTSIYRVTPDKLTRITDLPSAGDTSYPGIVQKDGCLYISYYTSNMDGDYPWLLGLVTQSNIMMTRIPLDDIGNITNEDVQQK